MRRGQFNFNVNATINGSAVTLTDTFTNSMRGVYKPSIAISSTPAGNWNNSIIAEVVMGACCVIDPSTCSIDRNLLETGVVSATVNMNLSHPSLGKIDVKNLNLLITYPATWPSSGMPSMSVSLAAGGSVNIALSSAGADVPDLAKLSGQSELFGSLVFGNDPVKGAYINVSGTFHHSVDTYPYEAPQNDVIFNIDNLQFTNIVYRSGSSHPSYNRPLIRLATQVGSTKVGTSIVYSFDLCSYLIPESSNPFPSLAPNYLNTVNSYYSSSNYLMCFLKVLAATAQTFLYYMKLCANKKSNLKSYATPIPLPTSKAGSNPDLTNH